MKTADFDFDLPPEQIAAYPTRPRDHARLLVVENDQRLDQRMTMLPSLLSPGDVLVFNDTSHSGAPAWASWVGRSRNAVAAPRSRTQCLACYGASGETPPKGDEVCFAPGFSAEVLGRLPDGGVRVCFRVGNESNNTLSLALKKHGEIPLPPYIPRPEGPQPSDQEDYQTLFAQTEGAIAAPTAGLHFTPSLVESLRARGVIMVPVTLHVGAGTFLPVKTESLADHQMHAEAGIISEEVAKTINAARSAGGQVTAVGTTVLRLLETVADRQGNLRPFFGDTDLFITPGRQFRIVDRLLTNFHLPRSTLFVLVCAFAGIERMRAAYDHAIRNGYRFYSYGDGSLLRRAS
ncbi:S-adenosylmethionine:tRNA ribosyltransferase-isomerase [Azospirillaceae bacterium]